MKRLFVIVIICTLLILPARPASAQSESCTVIYYGSGYGPVSVSVPSWATTLRAVVDWRGLQLRLFVDGVVAGSVMNNEPNVRTALFVNGWGGIREIKFGGIMLDYVRDWTLYACGSPPPTPTPTPAPTATPWIVDGPGCESRVGEPAEAVTGSLTIYGPPAGWYVVTVFEDTGASGAQGVRWRLDRSGSGLIASSVERVGPGSFDVAAGQQATITILGASGPGVPMLWVAVSAVCRGLEATPVAPSPDDIKPVEYGVIEEGSDCPMELPRVVFAFSPPMLPLAFNFDFPGLKVCFVYKRLLLGWGNFNIVDWAVPLLVFGYVWSAWLALRRG